MNIIIKYENISIFIFHFLNKWKRYYNFIIISIFKIKMQPNSSTGLAFNKGDNGQKNNFPPTPLTELFKNINNELVESSDKSASKVSLIEIETLGKSLSSNETIEKKDQKNNIKRADTDLQAIDTPDRKVDCIPESKQRKDDDDDEPFSLSVRQPSFSNLTAGKLIVKGVDENECHLESVIEEETNPVVVLTTQTEKDQLPISLQVREASRSHFDVQDNLGTIIPNDQNGIGEVTDKSDLLDSIAKRNAERLRKIGYNPSEDIPQNSTEQKPTSNLIDTLFNQPQTNSSYQNASNSNFGNGNPTKIKRVTSAGSDFRNPSESIFPVNNNEIEGIFFDSSKNYCRESSNEKNNALGFESNDIINNLGSIPVENDDLSFNKKKQSKNDRLNPSAKKKKTNRKDGWKANSFSISTSPLDSDLVEHNFSSDDNQPKPPPIDLKTVKTQQFMNDSDTVSPIPKRLQSLIFNEFHAIIPEESVAYLALSGSDVIGYKEARINDAMLSLRLLLKRSIDLGFITESAYIQGIIDQTINRQKEFKKFNVINPAKVIQENLTTAKAKKEVKEKAWNARLSAANSEYELALNDLNRRYQEEKKMLYKKWHSKSSTLKYRKPSSSLNNMKYVAKKMLNTHRFEEAASLTKSIARSENHESAEALRRMENDYNSALSLLERKYENERLALKTQFDSRQSMLAKREKVEMTPLDRTVEKFVNQKEQLSDSRKRNPDNSKGSFYFNKKKKNVVVKSNRLPPNLTINSSLKLNLKSVVLSSKDDPKRRTQSRLSRPSSHQQNRSSDLSEIFN